MNNVISLVCPTRGRAERCLHMLESVYKNAKYPEKVQIVLVFDNDDHENYNKILYSDIARGNNVTHTVVERGEQIFAELYNIGFNKTNGNIVGVISDDVEVKTKNWDEYVNSRFDMVDDKIYLVAPHDLQHSNIATHFFVSRRSVYIMGFLQPPFFVADFGDLWYSEVYQTLKRFEKTMNIVFEHKHFSVENKSEMDQTYADAIERKKGVPKSINDPNHPWKKYSHVREKNVVDLYNYIINFKRD